MSFLAGGFPIKATSRLLTNLRCRLVGEDAGCRTRLPPVVLQRRRGFGIALAVRKYSDTASLGLLAQGAASLLGRCQLGTSPDVTVISVGLVSAAALRHGAKHPSIIERHCEHGSVWLTPGEQLRALMRVPRQLDA